METNLILFDSEDEWYLTLKLLLDCLCVVLKVREEYLVTNLQISSPVRA